MIARVRKGMTMQPGLWLALLFLVLALRLVVPQGWMLDSDGPGLSITPCSGVAPAEPHAMQGHAHHHHAPMPDHPCAFAGVAMAAALDAAPALAAPTALARANAPQPLGTIAIGRGLAAPPPPQTGPPALA